jgi:hypothetical protein
MAEIVDGPHRDIPQLKELVGKIRGREDALDNESRAFFNLALEALEEAGQYV